MNQTVKFDPKKNHRSDVQHLIKLQTLQRQEMDQNIKTLADT